MFNDFYKNKKIFITGHTGFKGSWLCVWLTMLGAEVCGYSLAPQTKYSMFRSLNIENKISKSIIGNILDDNLLQNALNDFNPDIVFHLAAQPIVRTSYLEPVLTYKTNVMGTLNVLEAARNCQSVKAFINVTTDKCYENIEQEIAYKEDDLLGGYDMYSSSKACSEILSSSYRRSFLKNGFGLATVRAGNVIGGGDWAIDRLVPDVVTSIVNNNCIIIRNPKSTRPWQHVLEPLSGYLLLAKNLYKYNEEFASSFNFGPSRENVLTVEQIVKKICKCFSYQPEIIINTSSVHEASLLMLNIDKAKSELGWEPSLDIDDTLKKTVDWYNAFYKQDIDMYDYTLEQIKEYEGVIKWKKNFVIK